MLRAISEVIRAILGALQIGERLPIIPKKTTIEITEPKSIYAPTHEDRFQTIKGKIHNYQSKNHSEVLLINLSHSMQRYFPQNGIKPNAQGEWQGDVFLRSNDRITIFAVVVSDSSLLKKLCD